MIHHDFIFGNMYTWFYSDYGTILICIYIRPYFCHDLFLANINVILDDDLSSFQSMYMKFGCCSVFGPHTHREP